MSSVCEVRCRANQSYVGEELCGAKYNQTGSTQGAAVIQVAGYTAQFNGLAAGGQSKIDDAARATGSIVVTPTLGALVRYFVGIGKKFTNAAEALNSRNFPLAGLNPLAVNGMGVRADYSLATLRAAIEEKHVMTGPGGTHWEESASDTAQIERMVGSDGQVYTRVTLAPPTTYDLSGKSPAKLTPEHPVVAYFVEYDFNSGNTLAGLRVVRHKLQAFSLGQHSFALFGGRQVVTTDTTRKEVVFEHAIPGVAMGGPTVLVSESSVRFYEEKFKRDPAFGVFANTARKSAIMAALFDYQRLSLGERRAFWQLYADQADNRYRYATFRTSSLSLFVERRVAEILGVKDPSEAKNGRDHERPGEGVRDTPRSGEGPRTVERAGNIRAGEARGGEHSKAPERRRGLQLMEWFKKGRGK